MGLELLKPPRPMESDESVAELVERHFGAEVVDRLADPLLSGIYGGDAAVLSARTVLPRLVEMEEKYGSLSRGMLAAHAKARQAPMPTNGNGRVARSLFSSLQNGMQEMVSGIEARLDPKEYPQIDYGQRSSALGQRMERRNRWNGAAFRCGGAGDSSVDVGSIARGSRRPTG